MELRDYLEIIKKNLIFVLFFAIFGTVVAFVLSANLTNKVSAQKYFFVNAERESFGDSYQYEGFYSQEKARNFTDTAVSILESWDFSSEVLSNEETLAVRKIAPQVIRLSVASSDSFKASEKLNEVEIMFNQKLADLAGSDLQIKIKPIGNSSQILPPTINKKITTVFGLLIGFTFAIFVIGLKTYLRL